MVISPKLVAFRTMTRIEYHIASSVVEACFISANFSGFWQHPILKWKTETEMRITKKSLVVCAFCIVVVFGWKCWLYQISHAFAFRRIVKLWIKKVCQLPSYYLWGHSAIAFHLNSLFLAYLLTIFMIKNYLP